MKILATYCSALKDRKLDPLPAYKRYISGRVNEVMAIAKEQNIPFRILSGRFGLIHSDQPISYYDYLLRPDKVGEHAKFIAQQIKENNITEIDFYSRTIEEDPNLEAYHNCMKISCELTGVSLLIIHDNFQE